jgi:hypothetical protein
MDSHTQESGASVQGQKGPEIGLSDPDDTIDLMGDQLPSRDPAPDGAR